MKLVKALLAHLTELVRSVFREACEGAAPIFVRRVAHLSELSSAERAAATASMVSPRFFCASRNALFAFERSSIACEELCSAGWSHREDYVGEYVTNNSQ